MRCSWVVPPVGLLHLASAFEWAAACTYMPNASWRRAGVATARGGVSPGVSPTRRARQSRVIFRRKIMGTPLPGARGGAPLSGFGCGFCSCISANQGRRCGQEQARGGGGGGTAKATVAREETSSSSQCNLCSEKLKLLLKLEQSVGLNVCKQISSIRSEKF